MNSIAIGVRCGHLRSPSLKRVPVGVFSESVDGKLTCPVDVAHELTAILTTVVVVGPVGMWAKVSMSPCCAATRGQRSRSAERIVHISTEPAPDLIRGRRARQAVLGGPSLSMIEEHTVAGEAGQAAGTVKDGQGVVGIVMNAHLGFDEVRAQRARRQLQHEI